MSITRLLLSQRGSKDRWYERLVELPLTEEERIAVDELFTRRNPTFGQAFAIREIERKYEVASHGVA
jgi:hypothetical protein